MQSIKDCSSGKDISSVLLIALRKKTPSNLVKMYTGGASAMRGKNGAKS